MPSLPCEFYMHARLAVWKLHGNSVDGGHPVVDY